MAYYTIIIIRYPKIVSVIIKAPIIVLLAEDSSDWGPKLLAIHNGGCVDSR